jgi:hypothetical protein
MNSCTCQKPLNLHLYIPPTSAHPSSCFTGTTAGHIIRFWQQNPNLAYYHRLVSEFATHLESRGCAISDVERAMLSAATNIDTMSHTTVSKATPTTITAKRLYIHLRYSTHGPGRQTLFHLYNKHFRGHDGFDEMIVAFPFPKILRDLLTHTVLNKRSGGRMGDIISSSRSATKALREQGIKNPRTTTTSPNPHNYHPIPAYNFTPGPPPPFTDRLPLPYYYRPNPHHSTPRTPYNAAATPPSLPPLHKCKEPAQNTSACRQ